MESGDDATAPARADELIPLIAALVVALVAERFVTGLTRSGRISAPSLQLLFADIAVWAPLLAGAAWAVRSRAKDAARPRISFRIGLVDVFAAIAIACVCRALDAYLSTALFGSTGLIRAASLDGGQSALTRIVLVAGACLVSPFVEELFFRGVGQRALAGVMPRTAAVLLSAAAFAVVHVLIGNATSSVAGLQLGVTTFVLGALAGLLVQVTGRLGGAILAHILFNAIAVALTWPA